MSLMVWFGPFLFFSAFFLVFLHLLLLVVDLLRLSITDEKYDGSTNEDNGAPGCSITETERIDSVVSIVIFIIVVIIVVSSGLIIICSSGLIIVSCQSFSFRCILFFNIKYSVIVIIIVLVVRDTVTISVSISVTITINIMF